jgi:hypothetical protein
VCSAFLLSICQLKSIAIHLNLRQMDWGQLRNLADKGFITGPGGAPFAAVGAVVNCPTISQLG